jgi:2-keto-3-deoxy-galactonokinase
MEKRSKPQRRFFILVYEKSSEAVKVIVQSQDTKGLDDSQMKSIQNAVLKRKSELHAQYPKSKFEVVAGGMISSINKVRDAFSHLHEWDRAVVELLAV